MAFEDYQTKDSVVIVYTGNGKGKTSASVGLMARALGRGFTVAFVQFIKTWPTGEHQFIEQVMPSFKNQLTFYKGGKGFYNAGELSEAKVSETEHREAARSTFDFALDCAKSDDYDIVICDEISNAVHDGLLSAKDLNKLLESRAKKTSLCLTGRNFPEELLGKADIVTSMTKVKHHFDDKFLANVGIDY
ncbi:MAG TPA: cob(I)yrinic acid a,c-diamide adenosyltransferase [Candidatus Saccharimonadales bacterium]|nr:cob(I)yrinic acid a,c-diamide adenosyltransferase [Candidatus Saccharimonadales bacterium]